MNWIKYGFGPDFLEYHNTLPFRIDFSSAIFSNKSHETIIKESIDKIVQEYPGPYTLLCSGGVDSQAMILAWKNSGYPFNIVSAVYNNGLNEYDLTDLYALLNREHLSATFINIDIIKFHETELTTWAKKYNCASPHILSHMYVASKIAKGTVLSSGLPIVRNKSSVSYHIFGMERYRKISGQSMVPYFWFHDQTMSTIFQTVDTNDDTMGYEYKCNLYKKIGLNIIPQSDSFNGFEEIKEIYDQVKVPFRQKMLYRTQPSKRSYDLLFRYPLLEVIKPVSEKSTITVYF